MDKIKAAGYSLETPVLITNHTDLKEIKNTNEEYAYLGNLHTFLFRHGLGIASPPLLLTYVNNIIS